MISCSVRHTRQPHQWEGSLHGHRIQVRGQLWMQVRDVTMMMRMVALYSHWENTEDKIIMIFTIPLNTTITWSFQVRIHDHRRRHKDMWRGSVGIIILIIKEIKSTHFWQKYEYHNHPNHDSDVSANGRVVNPSAEKSTVVLQEGASELHHCNALPFPYSSSLSTLGHGRPSAGMA